MATWQVNEVKVSHSSNALELNLLPLVRKIIREQNDLMYTKDKCKIKKIIDSRSL